MTGALMAERIMRSRTLFEAHWPHIARLCPDPRIRDATLEPIEGVDADWARDYDHHGVDHIATAPNNHQTFIAARTQTVRLGETFVTITLRDREVSRIANGDYIAQLHIQCYGDLEHIVRIIVAEYTPQFRTYLAQVEDDDPRWKPIDEPGQPRCRMLNINVQTLESHHALIWHHRGPICIGGHMSNGPDDVGAAAAAGNAAAAHPVPTSPDRASNAMPDVPATWVAAMRLAGRIHQTPFVPRGLRGDPHSVLACILTGQELGLGPMTSLRMVNVIEGRPAASAELMRALVNRQGHLLSVVEATQSQVTLFGKRHDTGAHARVTWTLQDATRAKLTGNPAWAKYPRSMLLARATSELCRMLFPDVIGGLYTEEETAAIEGRAWEPQEGELIDPVTDRTLGVSQESGEAGEPRSPAEPEQSGEGDIGTLDTPSPDIPLPLEDGDG